MLRAPQESESLVPAMTTGSLTQSSLPLFLHRGSATAGSSAGMERPCRLRDQAWPARFAFFAARFSFSVFCGGFFVAFFASNDFAMPDHLQGVGLYRGQEATEPRIHASGTQVIWPAGRLGRGSQPGGEDVVG